MTWAMAICKGTGWFEGSGVRGAGLAIPSAFFCAIELPIIVFGDLVPARAAAAAVVAAVEEDADRVIEIRGPVFVPLPLSSFNFLLGGPPAAGLAAALAVAVDDG